MEAPLNENENSQLEQSLEVDVDQQHQQREDEDNTVPHASDHGGPELEGKSEFNEEEIRGILKVISLSGKFWHDWDILKSMISFQLKQVLSEYPEAKMVVEQQNASSAESYTDLLKRLDEALLSFVEGAPFTLQRICEILLSARCIYPNLSKLAFAIEKNLLVTSTLTMCTDPYPQTRTQTTEELKKPSEEHSLHSHSVQNGVEAIVGDGDEEMTEVEQADVDDEMTIDMEALDEIVGSSETNSTQTGNS